MELKETIKAMIKVMQHYVDGGEIEYSNRESNIWSRSSTPIWDWHTFKYRIKEPKQKVTIEKWLMQSTIDKEYRVVETSSIRKYALYKKVKLLESYEIEL